MKKHFTLIEMLIVMAIGLIIFSMIFSIRSSLQRKHNKCVTEKPEIVYQIDFLNQENKILESYTVKYRDFYPQDFGIKVYVEGIGSGFYRNNSSVVWHGSYKVTIKEKQTSVLERP